MLFFGKRNKKKQSCQAMQGDKPQKAGEIRDFYLGVQDVFQVNGAGNLVVTGRVNGTITTGAAVYIANLGEDDAPIGLTTVTGIEINGSMEDSATDTVVGVSVEAGERLSIKTGSVLFSRNTSMEHVHDAYIQALGESYISGKKMELEEEDYDKMSLTDLAELRRLYCWMIEQKKEQETE